MSFDLDPIDCHFIGKNILSFVFHRRNKGLEWLEGEKFCHFGLNNPFKVCLYETYMKASLICQSCLNFCMWSDPCLFVLLCFGGYCCLGRVKRVFTQTQLIYTQVWEQGRVAPSHRRHALGNNAVKPVHSGWSFRNARLFSHTSISQILWLQLSNSNSPYESTSINHSATLLFSTPSNPFCKKNKTQLVFLMQF